jgi:hypothetical protein
MSKQATSTSTKTSQAANAPQLILGRRPQNAPAVATPKNPPLVVFGEQKDVEEGTIVILEGQTICGRVLGYKEIKSPKALSADKLFKFIEMADAVTGEVFSLAYKGGLAALSQARKGLYVEITYLGQKKGSEIFAETKYPNQLAHAFDIKTENGESLWSKVDEELALAEELPAPAGASLTRTN